MAFAGTEMFCNRFAQHSFNLFNNNRLVSRQTNKIRTFLGGSSNDE
jgi:hypothetical protein